MQLVVNGNPIEYVTNRNAESNVRSLNALLYYLGYQVTAIAVAIDGVFVPRHCYDDPILVNGQVLEIVAPMQGG